MRLKKRFLVQGHVVSVFEGSLKGDNVLHLLSTHGDISVEVTPTGSNQIYKIFDYMEAEGMLQALQPTSTEKIC